MRKKQAVNEVRKRLGLMDRDVYRVSAVSRGQSCRIVVTKLDDIRMPMVEVGNSSSWLGCVMQAASGYRGSVR